MPPSTLIISISLTSFCAARASYICTAIALFFLGFLSGPRPRLAVESTDDMGAVGSGRIEDGGEATKRHTSSSQPIACDIDSQDPS